MLLFFLLSKAETYRKTYKVAIFAFQFPLCSKMANYYLYTANFGSNIYQLGDTIPVKPTISVETVSSSTGDSLPVVDRVVHTIKPVAFRPRVIKATEVDTVCHICPKGEPISLLQVLTESYNSQTLLPEATLYGKADFAKLHKDVTPVFIETTANTSSKAHYYPYEKNFESKSSFSEWVFLPIVALLFLVAVIRIAYGKYLLLLFQGFSHLFYAEKIFQEKSMFAQRANMFLDLLYFFSLPYIVLFTANYFDTSILSSINPFLALLIILLAFFSLRIFRFITIKSIGYISGQWDDVNLLYFNQLLFLRIIGLINVPVLFFLAYTDGTTHKIILLIALSLLCLSLILRSLRMFQVFIKKGFSIFYFLLYLCALEIIPLLILIKEANRW